MTATATEAADLAGLGPDHDGKGDVRVVIDDSTVPNDTLEGVIRAELGIDEVAGVDGGLDFDLLSGGGFLHITKDRTRNIN